MRRLRIALVVLFAATSAAAAPTSRESELAAALLAREHLFEVGWIAFVHVRDARKAERIDAGVQTESSVYFDKAINQLGNKLLKVLGGRRLPHPIVMKPLLDAVACEQPCVDERKALVAAAEPYALRAARGESLDRAIAKLSAGLEKGAVANAYTRAKAAGLLLQSVDAGSE